MNKKVIQMYACYYKKQEKNYFLRRYVDELLEMTFKGICQSLFLIIVLFCFRFFCYFFFVLDFVNVFAVHWTLTCKKWNISKKRNISKEPVRERCWEDVHKRTF